MELELIETRKIWDGASHNAFTDLVRFNGAWYCAFREAETHVSDDGKLRVIRSSDGKEWCSVALMDWQGGDVRDAHLSITGHGELMLNGAVRILEAVDGSTPQSVTWISGDGQSWRGPFSCPSGIGTWRWSVTWHKGVAYSFGYSARDEWGGFYSSVDGKSWETVRREVYADLDAPGNETSLLFTDEDHCYCLLRRDQGSCTALLGEADPPYTDWVWRDLGVRIGGPKMIAMGHGCFLSAVRLYDDEVRTSLCSINVNNLKFEELLSLPSGGDTSYAGMVLHNETVWVSYYSSHEEKSNIYLAKVKIKQ